MNIHQISVNYVQEQDRLMIRINCKEGSELRAWLTRRLALALLPVLNQTVVDQIKKIASPPGAATSLDEQRRQLLTAFQKEASLRSGDFDTPYREQSGPHANLPLGPEPLLLTEVKGTLMDNGQLRLKMFEKLPGREAMRNFRVVMDAKLSNGLLHLLHQSLMQSQWLQTPPVSIASEIAIAADAEPAELARPKYLN